MAIALAHPKHGYYRTRDPLGRAGDFITAPEISQTFGELLGLWSAVVWQTIGLPQPVSLVELGPGRGTLMKDALRAARRVPEFLAALEVHLVETSPALKTLQEGALRESGPALHWHAEVTTLPARASIVIANEFFDALPVRQFVRTKDGWAERMIGEKDGALCWTAGEPLLDDSIIPADLRGAAEGSIYEISPAAQGVIEQLAAVINQNGGGLLIIDYGHVRSALGDTLQAVKAHQYHDPLKHPGEADITCHVDFEALASAARRAGLGVFGPRPQGEFLRALGIEQRLETLVAQNPEMEEELRGGVERLIDPGQMGRMFKVMAMGKKDVPAFPGFD